MAEPEPSEAFAEALAQIEQISRLSDGLALVLIAAPATHAREGLERIAARLATERQVLWHPFDRRGADLNETLATASERPALLVHGLEWLADEDRHEVERRLNLARDPLVSTRALIVFWLDEQLLDEFRRLCPDLFHWRSLLLTLQEEDLPLSPAIVELRRYARWLHKMRPVRPDGYFEPLVRPPGERRSMPLSSWALEVDHGCLVGRAGSGKSTGVAMYAADQARRASEDGGVLPLLLVPARVPTPPASEDGLAFTLRTMAGSLPEKALSPELLGRFCKAGELQIILDGFDEISPPDQPRWIDWLDRLRRRHPLIRTLVVSRHGVFRSPRWRFAEVRPWGKETVERFLEKEIPLERERREFIDRLRQARLLTLASSPILLDIMVDVYRRTGALPRDRMSLLAAYVEPLLGRWDAVRNLSSLRSTTSPQTLRWQLAALALQLLQQGDAFFGEQDLAGWSDPHEEIRYLVNRTGLIREAREGTYAFSHPILLEFFAAEGLVELGAEEALPPMLAHRDDARWGEVLALAAPRLLELTSERDTVLRDQLAMLISRR